MSKEKELSANANNGMLNGIVELTTSEELLVDAALGVYFNINDFMVNNPPTPVQENQLNRIGFVVDGTYATYSKNAKKFAKAICGTKGVNIVYVETYDDMTVLECCGYNMYVFANEDEDGYLVTIDDTHTIDYNTLSLITTSMFSHLNKLLGKIYN